VRATAAKGNFLRFGDTKCWIRGKNGNLLGMGTMTNKLYYLDCRVIIQEQVVVASVQNEYDIWHQRLGHLNERQLKEMTNYNMVKGMRVPKSLSLSFCEKCAEEKITKRPFKTVGEIRSERRMQRVHSDVCGHMPTESIGGIRYFIIFIDDYTRYCKVYFMKNKSEAFDKFKEFELYTTNEYDNSLGTLRSDNGGEYLSQEFESYLQSKEINHELSAPYSPAQNGIAEILNRTLTESARAMMSQAGLSEHYWAETVATAAYLRNIIPTRALKEEKTRYEKWFEKKPDIGHLRVFGCMAYTYIPDVNRKGKLSKKAEKLRFIGYSLQSKAYRLIDENTSKVYVRHDVIFNVSDFNHGVTTVDVPDELVADEVPAVTDEIVSLEEIQPDDKEQNQNIGLNDQEKEQQCHRYPRRQRTAPARYGVDEYIDVAFISGVNEPDSIEEALDTELSEEWKSAAESEIQSLTNNETWELTELPSGCKPLGCKWIFKIKRGSDGQVERYKARLVAKGYTQRPGEDYKENFSPVIRYSSICALFSFAVQHKMMIHQMDVVTAFLNSILEEDIYMQQPPGFIEKGREHLVCKLKYQSMD
jgi:transposase InsO family protein